MPVRQIPLIKNEIYHICNRGIDRKPTFLSKKDYQRGLQVIQYYQYKNTPIRLSRFLRRTKDQQDELISYLKATNEKIVEFYTFCFMPNHYHFLIKQKTDDGISRFISQFQNSYTKYFNTLNEKEGPLFLDQFKAVRIETDEQFIHVSRYIHLNPYTGYLIKDLESLINYPWSSIREYLHDDKGICNKNEILSLFKNVNKYKMFILDQANYQRELGKIKHLTLED